MKNEAHSRDGKDRRDRIERVARIYANNKDASEALGIAFRSFGRLCREYGIETPSKRKLRHARDSRKAG